MVCVGASVGESVHGTVSSDEYRTYLHDDSLLLKQISFYR